MTATLHVEEFLAAYLVETEEHLGVANAQLLAIESAQKAGAPHPRAVRDVFRALHTIKGLSAMVGVEPIVAIAHRMEAFLREFERAGGLLSPGAIDALLRGVAAIERRLTVLGRGGTIEPPEVELVAALDSLGPSASAVSEAPARTLDLEPAFFDKLAAFEVEQILRGVAEGQRALRGEFSPSPARAAAGLSINSVRERLATVAEIVRVLPRSVTAGPDAPGGLSFVLIFITNASDELIAEAVGIEAWSLQDIHSSAALEAASEPAPSSLEPELLGRDDVAFDAQTRRGLVRVDVNRLDDALEGLSSLIVTRFRLARAVAALKEQGVNTREMAQIMTDNARQLRDLRAAIVRLRMVPVSELFERVPLLVRGLRRAMNRTVRLELDGGNAELDKSVSERLFPAIVHLVRNAVDHAIETPDERLRRGKPEEGLLRITAGAHSNTRLEIVISDDGRGIDAAAVAKRAGRPVPVNSAELLQLVCLPGLSTREVVTTTSGRGLGMEIVKRTIVDELGGELELATELGKGTSFTLRVPLTISIVDAFSFECGEQRFVVPISMVEEIVEIDAASLVRVPADDDLGPAVDILSRRGLAVPVVRLSQVFRLQSAERQARKAIIVRRAGAPVAFAIDRMLGQQEIVIRPLRDALLRAPGISGATDLGDGQPTLVLDLVALSSSLNVAGAARRLAR